MQYTVNSCQHITFVPVAIQTLSPVNGNYSSGPCWHVVFRRVSSLVLFCFHYTQTSRNIAQQSLTGISFLCWWHSNLCFIWQWSVMWLVCAELLSTAFEEMRMRMRMVASKLLLNPSKTAFLLLDIPQQTKKSARLEPVKLRQSIVLSWQTRLVT